MSFEGCAAFSRVQQPAAWPFGTLCFYLNMLSQVWETAADYNGCLASLKFFKKVLHKTFTICSGLQPDHSAEQFAKSRRARKAVKTL